MSKVRLRVLVFAAVVGLAVMVQPAKADVIFSLDCSIVGSTCTPGGPYGTITLADSGSNILVTALLFSAPPNPWVISLNWNPALGGSIGTSADWTATGGTVGVGIDASGYNEWFDIRIQDSAPDSNPLVFTLSKSFTDLSPSFFETKDKNNLYYAVLRAEDVAGAEYYYGSQTVVPEPASLLLLGGGLLGLGRAWRKRKH